jgi:spore germination protein
MTASGALRRIFLVFVVLAASAGVSPDASASSVPNKVRWGYYITYDGTSLTSLQNNIGHLDIVSPYFYQLNADGTVTGWTNNTANQLMRSSGIKIVPMIKNISRWDDFHVTIETPEKRDAIVAELVKLVDEKNYDGIHIDFEAVNASDRDLITDFMKRLSNQLWARDKLVTQAVIARTSDTSTTWGGAYDYAELAKYNDFIVIMAYDFHSVGSTTPGPVAPVDWVERVTKYSVTRIPKQKILLGMPFYGYNWNVDKGPPAQSMRFDQTMALSSMPDAQWGYDQTAQTPWVRYTDTNGDKHEVWFENVDSLRAKINVMFDYDLGGMATWRLGHEDPGVWFEIAQLATPASPIAPFPSTATRLYFPETRHSLSWGFKHYWEHNGGLPIFGYPRTEEFIEFNHDSGKDHTVQYFERQRYEYHPELAGTPYEVLLGRLGHEHAKRRGLLGTAPFQPSAKIESSDCLYFEPTGHNACGLFLKYWQSYGLNLGDPGISYRESLALFGFPISEPFIDPETGLLTQYFERAVMEHHPDLAGTPYEILLSLVGNDVLREKGWIR